MFSVIVPAYNEELLVERNTLLIKKEFDRIRKKTGESYEIIIVEESRDRTPEIAARLSRKFRQIRHIHSEKRLGKGGAVEKGIASARGSKIVFMDADLSTPLDITESFVEKMNSYDIVITSRYNPVSKVKRSFIRSLAGQGFSVLTRLLFRTRMRDTKCGYKGFRKSVAVKVMKLVREKGWFWDTEFLLYAEKLGYSIYEMPIYWYERKEGNVPVMDNIFEMLDNLVRLYWRMHVKKSCQ
ncbi:MAG: glycosyltransferase [Candidatus Aenigmarchaeota archaeon]|nr:glycosyltransferase [Candidatus Aenigmarchaeota archaeon]